MSFWADKYIDNTNKYCLLIENVQTIQKLKSGLSNLDDAKKKQKYYNFNVKNYGTPARYLLAEFLLDKRGFGYELY
jgi:hypothetical protein